MKTESPIKQSVRLKWRSTGFLNLAWPWVQAFSIGEMHRGAQGMILKDHVSMEFRWFQVKNRQTGFCIEYSSGFSTQNLHEPIHGFGMPKYREKSADSSSSCCILNTFNQTIVTSVPDYGFMSQPLKILAEVLWRNSPLLYCPMMKSKNTSG